MQSHGLRCAERVLGWLKRYAVASAMESFVLVSIPERVLDWLKPICRNVGSTLNTVSIPERVLGWLKRRRSIALRSKSFCFNP